MFSRSSSSIVFRLREHNIPTKRTVEALQINRNSMSLRYVITGAPNNLVAECSSLETSGESNYWMQLEQVTVNAVEKALQYQVSSQRLFKNSPVNASKTAFVYRQRLRGWSIDTDSEDRRHVAAKIYALLVQWKSDFSFEWRAKVAAAVHVFEEAMYQQAASKDDYTNPSLLEVQLIQVLRYFEEGNGGCLLEGKIPLQAFPCPTYASQLVIPDRLEDGTMERENRSGEMEVVDVDGAQATVGSILAVQMKLSTKEVANNALWEAILKGHKKALEENLQKLKEHASIKRRMERVVNLISKKKGRDDKRLKHELQKAMAESNPERLATMIACAKLAYSDELKEMCNAAEVMLVKLLEVAGASSSSSGEEDGPRRRKGKNLRERLRLECEISGNTEETAPQNIRNVDTERLKGASCSCRDVIRVSHVPCIDSNLNVQSDLVMEQVGQTEIQNQIASSPDMEDLRFVEGDVERINSVEVSAELDVEGSRTREKTNLEHDKETEELISEQLLDTSSDSCIQNTEYSEIRIGAGASPAGISHQDEHLDVGIPHQTYQVRETVEDVSQTVDPTGLSGASRASEAREISNRVSLMRLLAEGDEENCVLTNEHSLRACPLPCYSLAPSETWEEPTERLDPVCCVCMVGLKGSALIPCGHTFCRRCSRELCRGRGTCPLCNKSIQEILDIY